MPQWRKLHVKIVESFDVNDMPDDFTRLLWVLLPLKLDSAGRGIDDPSWVRSQVMPMRSDVTLEMISAAMDWYAQRGMIERYVVNGRPYFWVPTFAQYQGSTGREAPSHLPAPNSDDSQDKVQTNSRPTHDQGAQESSTDSDVDSETDSETDSTPTEADAPADAPSPKKSKTPKQEASQAMFSALATLCKIDWRVCTDEQRGALNSSEKRLREVDATPDDLGEFHRWWYAHDWRGKKNREPPEPHQVREEWGRFTAWREEIALPDPVSDNSNGADPLSSWWRDQLRPPSMLAQYLPHLRGSTLLSRDNGEIVVMVQSPVARSHLNREPVQEAIKTILGLERFEIVAPEGIEAQ